MNNHEIFASNLKYQLKINNKVQSDLNRDLNFPISTISEWCTGKKYPRIEKIQRLADYFNIRKTDLIELKEDNNGEI